MRGMFGVVIGAVAALTVTAATARAGSEPLAGYAGAKDQIMAYYAANGREGSGNCGPGHMADIADARVVRADDATIVLAVDYTYDARSNAGTNACTGTSQREFTLAKAGSSYEVTGMTGQTP